MIEEIKDSSIFRVKKFLATRNSSVIAPGKKHELARGCPTPLAPSHRLTEIGTKAKRWKCLFHSVSSIIHNKTNKNKNVA